MEFKYRLNRHINTVRLQLQKTFFSIYIPRGNFDFLSIVNVDDTVRSVTADSRQLKLTKRP